MNYVENQSSHPEDSKYLVRSLEQNAIKFSEYIKHDRQMMDLYRDLILNNIRTLRTHSVFVEQQTPEHKKIKVTPNVYQNDVGNQISR